MPSQAVTSTQGLGGVAALRPPHARVQLLAAVGRVLQPLLLRPLTREEERALALLHIVAHLFQV